jgi:hypothetical protein
MSSLLRRKTKAKLAAPSSQRGCRQQAGCQAPARRTGGEQADGAKRTKKEAGNDAAAVEKEVS